MPAADADPYLASYLNDLGSPEPVARPQDDVRPPVVAPVDALFDYNAGMDDLLRDVDMDVNAPAVSNTSRPTNRAGAPDGLGIDEEIQVTTKKRVVVKLDEERYDNAADLTMQVLMPWPQHPISSRHPKASAHLQGAITIQGKGP